MGCLSARLESADRHRAVRCEVPVEDFVHLPQELGCSLHRTAAGPDPGLRAAGLRACTSASKDDQARSSGVTWLHDPHGRFFRDVVGLVLQLYSGDLEAELTWSPHGVMDERVSIEGGETSHPLLFDHAPARGGPARPLAAAGGAVAGRRAARLGRIPAPQGLREKQSRSLTSAIGSHTVRAHVRRRARGAAAVGAGLDAHQEPPSRQEPDRRRGAVRRGPR